VTERCAVERQLERVLSSNAFRNCRQLSRFLRFAVDQALAGENGSSKETSIGVEIFGRSPDYDPGADPVVRVEARRLREKLAEYYDREGRDDRIHIAMPKGGYLPAFEIRGATRQPRAIAVLPFMDHSAAHELESLSRGLTARLIAKLAVAGLRVVSATSVFALENCPRDARRIGEDLSANLIVEGSLRHAGRRFRCDSQLISTSDGLHIWAGSFDSGRRDWFSVEDEFSNQIAAGVRAATIEE
jgi:adenylate cyclase